MKILRSENFDKLTLSIIGEIESMEEDEFLKILNENYKEFDLIFLDSKALSAKVINGITKNMFNGYKKIKVTVLKSQLFNYLSSLSIPVHFLIQKSILNIKKRFNIIAIGGSTDSLKKIMTLIKEIENSNITIFIVQHIRRDTKTLLPELLSKTTTKFTIKIPENGELVQNKTIYVAPPNRHMIVIENRIYLLDTKEVNFAKPSIDVLFKSLAKEYKDLLLVILVCGYGTDGFKSLIDVKKEGGTVILEDVRECNANLLIKQAISQGEYDYIMSIDYMSSFISEHTSLEVENLDKFLPNLLEEIYKTYDYDYRNYQKDSLKRRIKLIMGKEQIETFYELKDKILTNPKFFEKLFLEFSINVSTFFRDNEVFRVLKEKVLPYLNSFSHIKIWSAGCASGEEAYSIAIMLSELGMLQKSLIYATDINPFILNSANNGLYPKKKLKEYENNYLQAKGERHFSSYYIDRGSFIEIKKELKDKILFFQHSLVNSGVFNEFQLIICRNVLIYFNQDLQKQVLNLFSESLDRSGFLILGKSEKLNNKNLNFIEFNKSLNIYKKNKF